MKDLTATHTKEGNTKQVKIVNITFDSDGDFKKCIYIDSDGNIDEDTPDTFTILEGVGG